MARNRVTAAESPALAAAAVDVASSIEFAARLATLERRLAETLVPATDACGLSAGQFAVLWAWQADSAAANSQTALVTRLGLSPAHVSGLVEQLRQAGLLEGQRDPHDRRRQVWRITPAGQATLARLIEQVDSEGHFAALAQAARAELAEWLDRTNRNTDTNSTILAATPAAPAARGVAA